MLEKEKIQNYAIALFELSTEQNKTDEFYIQFKKITSAFRDEPDFAKVLNSYSIPNEDKYKMIDNVFSGNDQLIINFIKILSKEHMITKIVYIYEVFRNFYYEAKKIKRGTIFSTTPLTEKEIEQFTQKYSIMFNFNLILKNRIDKSIIGGVKIVIDDIVIDNTILNQLNKLKDSILK
ncbi:F0F1 ATP synthase subunit delta [Mycoplasma phocoenae]|uniref:ATP synthase subunit delta n=1 Tax=Mycoplasma phocoenae TaxID=754517 RepID=A0A858U3F1_9MOLU|nr:F0F1 ATP synthase subunit delta [Mycoplasma phocoenae]QJG67000.1 F0F1 ATP synthase subunit delta [Mycoplasma phocoenae]